MENRSLVVTRTAFPNLGQSLLVGLRACCVINRLPILIEDSQSIHVVPLAFGSPTGTQSAMDRFCALLQLVWGRRRPDRVIPGSSHTPISHAARGIRLPGFVERETGFFIRKRMEQSY